MTGMGNGERDNAYKTRRIIFDMSTEASRENPRHPNSARFHELLAEAGALHDQKQGDYGRGEDPFSNVRASEEWGIKGWVGAMVRAQDKVRRLQTFAQRGSLVNESVKDSLLDLAVYSLIALVLFEEEQGITDAA